ncbi:hypothetical protein ACFC09_05745 [Streptomyces sp. NPDC056161]|uniref:hypothetical protein n=1 Tax=Streptomyces sp. NPDC056161 TaxID=3345732 RepID=UPI0035D53B00
MNTTRRTRRTVRSATLLAVAAAAAFSLTACQGSGTGAAAGSVKNDSGSVSGTASGSVSTGDGGASNDAKTIENKDQTGVKTETSTEHTAAPDAAGGTKSSPVRTVSLVDGSKAEVYQDGDQDYLAKIVNQGSVLATLETNGHDAGLDANDMFVVLTMGGDVKSWMGGGDQGPGTFMLEGGWQAEVTKVGDLKYRAEILGNEGDVEATLETNGHDVGLDANGSYIVLSAGGVISSHM